jgi:hypothetical protein
MWEKIVWNDFEQPTGWPKRGKYRTYFITAQELGYDPKKPYGVRSKTKRE